MKKVNKTTSIFIRAAVTLFFLCLSTRAESMQWEKDKYYHAGASAVISGSIYLTCRAKDFTRFESYLIAVTITNAVGLAKEYTDDRLDQEDILANNVGALIAPLLLINF